MQIFWELDNVLGNAIHNILTTKQRRRRQKQQQKQKQKIHHICGLDAIGIKIIVIEHDRISGPENCCTVQSSSHHKKYPI
jgi:hypothetical protein